MSQNPEVKLVCNTELTFTEAHLTDLKPESCIFALFVFSRQIAELLVTVYFLVPFLPVIRKIVQ